MRSLNLNWIVEATDQSQDAGNGFGNRSAATHPLGTVLGVSIPITYYLLPITHYQPKRVGFIRCTGSLVFVIFKRIAQLGRRGSKRGID